MEEKKLPLEKELAPIFLEKAPALPNEAKEGIVNYGPYILGIFLVFGAFGLLAALGGGSMLDRLAGGLGVSLGPGYYVGLAISALGIVVGAMAIPKLLKRQKAGWDLLYYYELIGIVSAIFSSFAYGYFSVAGLLISLLISAVILWIVFQIREKYS